MKLLAITNLYPRPDQPRRGLYNAQLFAALAEQGVDVTTLVVVPEWWPWKWGVIRRWKAPDWRAEGGKLKSEKGRKASVRDAGPVSYVPVTHLPIIGRNRAWRFYVAALRRFGKQFESCDAVLATWLYPDAVAAGIVARQHGKPFWLKIHGTDRFHLEHPVRGKIAREVMQHAAGFLPNAQFLADYLVEHGVLEEKVHVVRHGVDHERFRVRSREEAWGLLQERGTTEYAEYAEGEGKVVLFVGNLEYIKGADRLLHAFARTRERAEGGKLGEKAETGKLKAEEEELARGPLACPQPISALPLRCCPSGSPSPFGRLSFQPSALLFIGDGRMRGQLEQMARQLNIADAVTFLGSRPHDEVALWMNAADCLCLPSRSEGMPNVVIEALASGCPVVATDVGDVRALVEDDVNGYVVGNEESMVPAGLAAAMARALDRVWDREAITGGACELTWERAAGHTRELLRGSRPTDHTD